MNYNRDRAEWSRLERDIDEESELLRGIEALGFVRNSRYADPHGNGFHRKSKDRVPYLGLTLTRQGDFYSIAIGEAQSHDGSAIITQTPLSAGQVISTLRDYLYSKTAKGSKADSTPSNLELIS